MFPTNSSSNGQKDVRVQGQSSNLSSSCRHDFGMTSLPKNLMGNDTINDSQDHEAMELYSRAKAKQEEILYLREQIALASVRESQLLNEKYGLEKKFSELRMALDEKQSEAIMSASNELARRKGDLEENLRLVNELKDTENDRYIFMSSMLGLLAEYGIFPRVANASSLTNNVKHLHDQLEMKIRTSHYIDGKHDEAVDARSRDVQASLHLRAESLQLNHEMHQQANIGSHFEISSNIDRSGCKIDELFMLA
uniref:Uncharacterized protein isoform X5 n=1 Tax=Nicotiana tabacum TaxID=4097 RepID=A0A1S4BEE2_TOBAC|nr:PREDICTED: uncharacterized protein LOC107807433 isoform X5 [Nicotiana tabacum]